MGLCWLAVSVLYYGLDFATSHSGGGGSTSSDSKFTHFALTCLADLPGYLLAYALAAAPRVGRRAATALTIGAAGGCLLVTPALVPLVPAAAGPGLALSLSLAGKFAASAGFVLAYLLPADIFPTSLCGLAIGVANVFARLGTMLAPLCASAPPFVVQVGTRAPPHIIDRPRRLGKEGGGGFLPVSQGVEMRGQPGPLPHNSGGDVSLTFLTAGRPRRHRRRDRGLRNGAAAGGALGGDSRGRRLRAHGPIYCAVVGCRFDRSRSCDLWARPNPSANRELRKRTNWHFAELSSMIRSASPRWSTTRRPAGRGSCWTAVGARLKAPEVAAADCSQCPGSGSRERSARRSELNLQALIAFFCLFLHCCVACAPRATFKVLSALLMSRRASFLVFSPQSGTGDVRERALEFPVVRECEGGSFVEFVESRFLSLPSSQKER